MKSRILVPLLFLSAAPAAACTSFLADVPDSILRKIAAYPEGFVCAEGE